MKNKKINQAVILAGGLGTRLGRVSKSIPKPLIKIHGIPFLHYLIAELRKNKISKILILCGYKGYLIKKEFKNFKDVKVIIEKKPLGTFGSLIYSKKYCDDKFLFLNGDSFFNIIFLNKVIHYEKYDNVLFLTKNTNYKSNNLLSNLGLKFERINFSKVEKKMYSGISILSKKYFKLYKKNQYYSFESDFIPKLIKKNLIKGHYEDCFFIDIGTKKNLSFTKKNFKYLSKKKCVFFDRDNTLILDKGYTYKPSQLIWNKGAKKAINYLNKLNYLVIVITNQSGVARGYYSEHDVIKFHNYMNLQLYKYKSCINDFFYCPFHINGKIRKYKKNSLDRKPNNGMILKAIKKWNINTKKSFFIGDSSSDKLAAKKSKIKFINYKEKFDLYKLVKTNIK